MRGRGLEGQLNALSFVFGFASITSAAGKYKHGYEAIKQAQDQNKATIKVQTHQQQRPAPAETSTRIRDAKKMLEQ